VRTSKRACPAAAAEAVTARHAAERFATPRQDATAAASRLCALFEHRFV